MKMILLAGGLMLQFSLDAQNVGIGTTVPLTRLHIEQGNVLFKGPAIFPATPGPLPVSGAGIRLIWYPDKAAFRAGVVTSNVWDADSIGNFSIAVGENSKATGNGTVSMGIGSFATGYAATSLGFGSRALGFVSIAIGSGNLAIGSNALAMGSANQALGSESIAMGSQSQANGSQSIAIGRFNLATAAFATAIGKGNTASGDYSTAFGADCTASGINANAFGKNATASGTNSFSIGSYISTSGYAGAFALGDASTTTVMNSFVANGFRARFAGGYRLFTNSATTIGAFLNTNANSWAALSDVRMKENFLPVDGENFLQKIAAMPLTTWNYIGQDVATLRHYGPMAQDFYKAFGRDGLGEIGCDTLINQQDFLGVNLIAIQALEKRTEKIDELAQKIDQQEKKLEKLEKENALLREQMNTLLDGIKAIKGAGTVRQ